MPTQMLPPKTQPTDSPQTNDNHLDRQTESGPAEGAVQPDRPGTRAPAEPEEPTQQSDPTRLDEASDPDPGPVAEAGIPTLPAEGSLAPNFMAIDQTGLPVSLEDFRGQWVVLFFTPSCGLFKGWRETLGFQRLYGRFQALGAEVMGISADSLTHNHQMANLNQLSFLLLSDWERDIFGKYGATNELRRARRVSFIIDPKGHVARVYAEVKVKTHPQQVLRDIEELLDGW